MACGWRVDGVWTACGWRVDGVWTACGRRVAGVWTACGWRVAGVWTACNRGAVLCLRPQDLVKSHLMYAVREEVEVLKEQIKELIERNAQLEQENNLLKNLASPEQMAQFQAQVQTGGSPTGAAPQPAAPGPAGTPQVLPSTQSSGPSA
ncbi:TSC22 domain family protein 1 [Liparis tanakae]|uniref:TSC22 domain family protein 1 n=1 Tax=Liparis tanakae TaxID=230148 RepID=A0A4Z2GSA3_9TELE|nr:TSC22 domain family protein 1 [Liparis tanakae]